jgi:hypothetical protein
MFSSRAGLTSRPAAPGTSIELAWMIARFQILLPQPLLVPAGVEYPPIELEHRGYGIRVGTPYKAELDPAQLHQESTVPVGALSLALSPAVDQPVSPTTTLDGGPAVLADALPIEVIADEFDRTKGTDDPPDEVWGGSCFQEGAFELCQSLIEGCPAPQGRWNATVVKRNLRAARVRVSFLFSNRSG